MIKWIKSLFKTDVLSEDIGKVILPSVDSTLPLPKVKPCKPEKDISEPVLSFVECVRKNPKRFDVDEDISYDFMFYHSDKENCKAYKLWDKLENKGWYITRKYYFSSHIFMSGKKFYKDPFFLTEDEKEYIIKEVKEIMEYRKERKTTLDKIRKERRIRDERNRLKEIYK